MKEQLNIKIIQKELLRVYKDFKKICDDNNLQYFAIGGTCIGAIRHKGFIPWDDDIDVAMPYEDYCEFKKIVENINTKYEILDSIKCKHFIISQIKFHDKSTTYIEEIAKNYPDRYTGIFIDVFPIFGMPKGKLKQTLCEIIVDIQNMSDRLLRFSTKEKESLIRKICSFAFIPLRKMLPYNFFVIKQEKYLKKYKLNNSNMIIFPWRKRKKKNSNYSNVFYSSDFDKSIYVPFEDTEISVPIGYDRYLKTDFGNYMELPPINKQKGNHNCVLFDTKKSYNDYKRELQK